MSSPSFDLRAVRSRIPILRTHVPLNNCSQAPQCEATRAAADSFLASWNERGMDWDAWLLEVEGAREEFAALIGAAAADVAVSSSVSHATASVASGLDFSGSRHRVVASEAEFPTVCHVWLAQVRLGAEVTWVPVRDGRTLVEDFAVAVDDRTLVVSACHGYYQTGFKQDIATIAEIAHARGALVYVDAYQTLGTALFDAPSSGADFVASGNLKFLLGMPGIAFLWVRPGLAHSLCPTITGWFGRRDPFAFEARRLDWADAARRFDTGTPPVAEAYVARAGMAWLREVGIEAIGAWTSHLGRCCVEGALARGMSVLGPIDATCRTPTTAIACEDAPAVESALRDRRVLASARGPAIRLAPHFYNTTEDVELALDALAAVLRTGR
jgi:selenocysteine lyase/cysteine desulfurase